MRASFIFCKNQSLENEYLYEESYIRYFVCSLLKKKHLTKTEIIDSVQNHINAKINIGRFASFLLVNFNVSGDKYFLKEYQEIALEKVNKFKEDLFVLEWDQEADLYQKIGQLVNYNHFDVDKAVPYSLAIEKIKNNRANDYILATYFKLITNKDDYLMKLDNLIVNVDEYYNDLSLKIIFESKVALELLFANGLYTVGDLASVSLETLFTLLSVDIDVCLSSLSQLQEVSKLSFKDDLREIFEGDTLSDKEKEVLSKRNGFNSKPLTLDETGQYFNVTRERCRQIESKSTAKVMAKSSKIRNQILMLFIALTTPAERRYISTDIVTSYMGDELLAKYYLFIIENGNFDLKFDSKLNIVYNSTLVSLDELSDEVINVYGPYIFQNDYDSLNKFEKSVIDTKYKEYYDGFYLLRGYQTKELIGLMVDELFPDGYRIGNEDDHSLLISKFQEKYKTDEAPSQHSISGFLERLDYCQIGKGTYKNRSRCPQLPQDLIDSMINYILMNTPVVYYQSIYSQFKNQLTEMGIDNYFYMKGLLDPNLPSDFKTSRNKISVGEVKISGYTAMHQFIKSFNGKFSINDLRAKYPGVKDYTFYNLLINECENGLIWLANKNFIYIDKVVIAESSIKELKGYIDNLYVQLETDTLSSRKIYAKLSLTNKTLLESLKIATDNFSLFSLIKYWFNQEYGFNRPLISKSKEINTNTYSLITNFANSQNSFNAKSIHDYCAKMNIGGLYSYLSFMEDMSDNFVQVNIDTMYKKEKMSISETHLKDFKGMMELIFSRFDSVDTRQFNGYQMLPNIPYHWNKYLLVGIIRSYFSDDYEVQNTETSYDSTDFIIRRNAK